MNYKEAIEEVHMIVSDAWKEIDSGFYPEIDEKMKLFAIQKMINDGYLEKGFWNLVGFLINDLLPMSEKDFLVEKERLRNTLRKLNNPIVVQQWLAKLKTESKMGKKAIEITESLQKNLMT